MNADIASDVVRAVSEAEFAHHRLVILVGPAGSGKTAILRQLADAHGWPRIDVNLVLSERLLELTQAKRARRVSRILGDLVTESGANVVVLDNLEILFGVDLHLAPLRLLQQLSRNQTIVASWAGRLENGYLVYAEASHPEYQREPQPAGAVIPIDSKVSYTDASGLLPETMA